MIYKIISKVIANRLKPFLNSIVLEAQSAFIADSLITYNILIAIESLHYMKTQSSGREGFMALKLDMSKAYDRVEFSRKIHVKDGVSGFMGGYDYAVCIHSDLFHTFK